MKKKKELIIILASLLVVVLSVTLAYFTTEIFGTGKDISLDSANLKITFSSGSGNISGVNIEPGWSSGASTFTVKNESKDTYKYNIVIKDLVNTFVTKGFLLYKVTSTDGGYNMSGFKDVPKSSAQKDKVLAYSVEIAKGATHTYNVEFKYENSSEVDQSDDMGKILSGTLYIEKGTEKQFEEGTLAEAIMFYNPKVETRTDFSTIFTTTNTGTLYKATESIAGGTAKDVYYFAGDAKNNWVKFAGFYWRIIRTNHDGSIRLLYSGTATDTTSGYIGRSVFNSSYNSPKYVGYMYGTDGSLSESRTNTNDSTIKTYIDNWYSTNLSSYTKYISTTAVYCDDRAEATGEPYSISSSFHYAPRYRATSTYNPTYDCMTAEDAFSGSNTSAKLKYSISLMTTDEIMYAGGKHFATITSPYVWYSTNSAGEKITGSYRWRLLSPDFWVGGSTVEARTFFVYNSGGFVGNQFLGYPSYVVRPVTSIKTDVLWSKGDGSPENPYEIVYN